MSRLSLHKTLPSLRNRFDLVPLSRRNRDRSRFLPLLGRMESRALLSTLHVGSSLGEYPQIQAAVLAANPGDTIQVDPGTYKEQVTISTNSDGVTLNNLTLEGSNQKSIIQLPSTAPVSQSTAIVEVSGARNVTINMFTIEGPGNGFGSIGYGVEVVGAGSANITNDHITQIRDNPLSGAQNGHAIQIGLYPSATGSATIVHDTIDDYQKSGIVVDNTGSSADIVHNTITGVGPTALIAQNGVEILDGANANVIDNTISGNVYTPQTVVSTGILLDSPGTVTIEHNTVTANDVGIYSYDASAPVIVANSVFNSTFDGIILDTTTGAIVTSNTTFSNGFGDHTGNPTGDGGIALFGSTDNTVSQNSSLFNKIDGIYVDSASTGNTFSRNTLIFNTVSAEDDSSGTGTAHTGNTWTQNFGTTSTPAGLVSSKFFF